MITRKCGILKKKKTSNSHFPPTISFVPPTKFKQNFREDVRGQCASDSRQPSESQCPSYGLTRPLGRFPLPPGARHWLAPGALSSSRGRDTTAHFFCDNVYFRLSRTVNIDYHPSDRFVQLLQCTPKFTEEIKTLNHRGIILGYASARPFIFHAVTLK